MARNMKIFLAINLSIKQTPKMNITKAKKTDAAKLTDLTIRSKSYWDYSAEQIEEWNEVLTITVEYIENNEVYQLIDNSQLIGYYSFLKLNESVVKLDNIFIDSPFIGKGYGKKLMEDLYDRIQQKGFEKIVLDSDPQAEAFYKKIGFKVVGQLASGLTHKLRYVKMP
jgi:ribosomal protein S18 acetylase RimI-like enzyme